MQGRSFGDRIVCRLGGAFSGPDLGLQNARTLERQPKFCLRLSSGGSIDEKREEERKAREKTRDSVDGSGWMWMDVDGSGWIGMDRDGSGWIGMDRDG